MMAILGIDISKKTFDATLLDDTGSRHHHQFLNTEAGFVSLQTWLTTHAVTTLHACMEATNIYWEDLAETLSQAGYQVSVVNPARTKGFALSQLKRNKTDKVDSAVIAEFCERLQPRLWTPPRPEQRQLRDFVRHLEVLKKTRTQHLNRLSTCRNPVVQQSFQTLVDTLNAQIIAIEAQIEQLFTTYPALQAQRTCLVSIQGIGKLTAAKMLGEMYDLEHYESAPAAAADAGATPAHHESGTSVRRRPRLSKVGKASLRGALYWPAITAMQHNPVVCELKARLAKRGKPFKVILGAAIRKLLHLAYGVLKHQRPFDPEYIKKTRRKHATYINQST
jgi:transposase